MSTSTRRIAGLIVLAAVLVAVVLRRRGSTVTSPPAPPEWPPLHPRSGDAPSPSVPAWVAAMRGESMPEGYPVKVKVSSGIYHVPGGRFYERTIADRWYTTAEAAEADGYRRSKN